MAISDYLMTRLGLAQQARGLAAQTEQARAQREAAQNRQNMAYLNALLQTGAQIPGMIGDIGAAQGAAGIQEATTGLEAGEIGEAAAALEAGEIGEAAAALPAGMSAASTLTGAQTAVPPDQLLETPPGTATNIKRIKPGLSEEDNTIEITAGEQISPERAAAREAVKPFSKMPEGAQAEGIYSIDDTIERKLEQLKKITPTPGQQETGESEDNTIEITAGEQISPERAAAREAVKPFSKMPESAQAEGTFSLDDSIARKLEQAKKASARASVQQFTPPVPGGPLPAAAELEGAFTMPSTAQSTILPTGVISPEETAAFETITIPGLNIPVPRPSARTVPTAVQASDKDFLPSAGSQDSNVKAAEQLANLDDPLEKAQKEYIKKINSYKPPKYKVPVQDAADKIVEDTWKNKQPNAILNFLSFGQYNNNLENAKRIAKKMVASEINGLRKQEGEAMRKQFIETAKLEAQQIAIMQKDLIEKRKLEFKGTVKTLNPKEAIEKLTAFGEVNDYVDDVKGSARNLITKGQKFPGGALKAIEYAKAMALAATPQEAETAAANLGLASASAGASFSIGATDTKIDVLEKAAKAIDTANMTDEAKDFTKKTMIMIQMLAKAKEGGRVTDKDLEFYMNNLIVDDAKDPSTLLKSIDYLQKVNARSQNRWNNIFNRLYGDEYGGMFADLQHAGFTEEELNRANELGFYEVTPEARKALGRTGRRTSMPRIAGEATGALLETAQKGLTAGKAAVSGQVYRDDAP